MSAVKVLFAAIPAYGHLYPLMPLALACAEAGHDVTVASGPPFAGRLPLRTVLQQPAGLALDEVVDEVRRRHPEAEGVDVAIGMFADVTAEAVANTLLPQLEAERPDLVVYEGMNAGAGVAAHVLGIPALTYAIGLTYFGFPLIHGGAINYRRSLWTDRHLDPPAQDTGLAAALLTPIPPILQSSTGPLDLPKIPIRNVAYVESLGTVPQWLSGPKVRPRLYLTLGTVSFGAVEVLRRALDDLADVDVDVLLTVGPEGDPTALGPVSERVHIERFVDQGAALGLVDLIVHHGGTGTVLGAAAVGIPQLLLPQGADHFLNVDIMTKVGAARALRNDEQEPGAIAAAVTALLADGPERATARRLQQEIAAMPAPAEVVGQLVAYAARGADTDGGGGGI